MVPGQADWESPVHPARAWRIRAGCGDRRRVGGGREGEEDTPRGQTCKGRQGKEFRGGDKEMWVERDQQGALEGREDSGCRLRQ